MCRTVRWQKKGKKSSVLQEGDWFQSNISTTDSYSSQNKWWLLDRLVYRLILQCVQISNENGKFNSRTEWLFWEGWFCRNYQSRQQIYYNLLKICTPMVNKLKWLLKKGVGVFLRAAKIRSYTHLTCSQSSPWCVDPKYLFYHALACLLM